MDELELGTATILYEDQDGDIVEKTVDNEQLVYARDHWMLKSGTDDEGNDLMSQIPRDRVVRVDRNVQQFEDQAQTVRHRVESFADDLREKLPVDVGPMPGGRRQGTNRHEPQSQTIPVEEGDEGEQ
jgi:hypothetical protein